MTIEKQEMDDALNMFRCGMVWDGNLCSKTARDRLVAKGYAVRHDGMQTLTGAGVLALFHPRNWRSLLRRYRRAKQPFLTADRARIRNAMN